MKILVLTHVQKTPPQSHYIIILSTYECHLEYGVGERLLHVQLEFFEQTFKTTPCFKFQFQPDALY